MDGVSITIQGGIMKYISLQTLIDHGKELRFQSADQMAKVYEQLSSTEIVRCKDCKHRDPEDKKCDCGHDIMWQLPREDNWFCADGERKER